MNTPSPSDSAGFNDFGSYRRKRGAAPRNRDDTPAKRSFRHIPDDGFVPLAPETPTPNGRESDTSDTPHGPKRSPRKSKPYGKPFGKKPYGKKPFKAKPQSPSFRDFADAMDDAPAPDAVSPDTESPLEAEADSSFRNRSFKHAARPFPHGDSRFPSRGKGKPFGKFRRPFPDRDRRDDDDAPPQPLRRPYGAEDGDGPDFPEEFPPPPFGKKPFHKGKPFGKKPFAKKFRPRLPFDNAPDGDGFSDGPKPFGKKPFHKGKPFGKKPFAKKFHSRPPFGDKPDGESFSDGHNSFGKNPFHKGKPFGKKPFHKGGFPGKKPFGKGKPFGKKPPR